MAPSEEYNLTVNPSSLVVYPGAYSTAVISVRSLGSFTGTVELNPYPNYDLQEGLSASVNPFMIQVPPGGTATSTLNVSATPSTPSRIYTVTLIVEVYPYENETVTISVAGFTMSSSSQMSEIVAGSSAILPVSITSYFGFEGSVHLDATISNPGPEVSLEASTLDLENGGTNTTRVHVHVPPLQYSYRDGMYGVFINATSGKLSELFTLWFIIPANSSTLFVALALIAIGIVVVAVVLLIIGRRRRHKLSMAVNKDESFSQS